MSKKAKSDPIKKGWYKKTDSDIVLVFLHGIFSDCHQSWYDKKSQKFWPDLIADDPRFINPSIFLAEFYTGFDSNDYGVKNCAAEVLSQLKRQSINGDFGPLTYKKIVFVCHSTGGIVARYLLESNTSEFDGIKVGFALFASPSYGSKMASVLGGLSRIVKNKLALELNWGGAILDDLDDRFKELLDKTTLDISGVEVYENRAPFHIPFLLPTSIRVVEKQSASRYFGKPILIPKSNHSSIVKPSSIEDESHGILLDFLTNKKFIKRQDIPSCSDKELVTKKSEGNPLFDMYSIEHEDFYYTRLEDKKIDKFLSNYSLWVCGPTGLGKTCLIQRALTVRGIVPKYIALGACIGNSVSEMFYDILLSLYDDNEEVVGSFKLTECLRLITKKIKEECDSKDFYLFIEEIPIKNQVMFDEFSECVYALMSQLREVQGFKIILSSIYEPANVSGGEQEKVLETFKVIHIEKWELSDIEGLIELISRECGVVSETAIDFNFSPRNVKNHYRDLMLNKETSI